MKRDLLRLFVCPRTGSKLRLQEGVLLDNDDIAEGVLVNEAGDKYLIKEGIPDFTIYSEHDKNDYAINLFKDKAGEYDKYQHLSFETFYQNETDVRSSMIDRLNLKHDASVLEVNAGTGRDSVLIAKRMSKEGLLHVQDISKDMLLICQDKIRGLPVPTAIHQGNAIKLPYADKVFDAVYSFGGVGMNTYSNNKEAIAEMVRVTKLSGRVVFGGLSMAPWLRNTFFAKVLTNHNSHYANEITFTDLPIQARNLNVAWILSGAGFVVDFTVGEGEPEANFDYEIPGRRGGTLRTRYAGKLEGVTKEAVELANKAQQKSGRSMHKWLDELIKREAAKVLRGHKA